MPLFRKKETYNEQMLREAGLDRVVFNTPQRTPEVESTTPSEDATNDSRRIGEWDAMTTVLVQIHGHRVNFTTLPEGDVIITAGDADDDLAPLADAIEEHLSPPYKASATRRDGNVWRVGAKRIEVATIPFPDAERLDLSQLDGVAELQVDGEPSDAEPPPELLRLGERVGGDFAVQAIRIDGDEWEVGVSPL